MVKQILVGIGLLSAIQFASPRARAALGQAESTLPSEQGALKVRRSTKTTTGSYTVHELEVSGATVREYVAKDGTVFAVTWKGIRTPDLKTLFGDYYDEYMKAKAATVQPDPRRHETVRATNLIVRRSGHMRSWKGRASLTSLVPTGVRVETLP